MSKSKGISPLIAAVLLIAFTMAVASLFAQWAPQLIQEAQGDTSNQSAEIQRCSGIIVEVTDGSTSQATIQQTSGENPAGNVSVTWYTSDSVGQAFYEITNNREATQVTGGPGSGTLEEIVVNPVDCEGAPTQSYS